MTRLYTFGCSFTKFHWPTWADILSHNFDYYENWGAPGRGNQYIFNSLIECHARNQFNSNDTIVIMWTCSTRVDVYNNNHWHILPLRTPTDVKKFVKNKDRSDIRGLLMQSLSLIFAAKELLDKWGVKYHFLAMSPIDYKDVFDESENPFQDVLSLYQPAVSSIKPSFYEVIYNFNWYLDSEFIPITPEQELSVLGKLYHNVAGEGWPLFKDFINKNFNKVNQQIIDEIAQYNLSETAKYKDPHPSPKMHLKYLQTVLPEYTISSSTTDWVNNFKLHDFFTQSQNIPLNRL